MNKCAKIIIIAVSDAARIANVVACVAAWITDKQ